MADTLALLSQLHSSNSMFDDAVLTYNNALELSKLSDATFDLVAKRCIEMLTLKHKSSAVIDIREKIVARANWIIWDKSVKMSHVVNCKGRSFVVVQCVNQ